MPMVLSFEFRFCDITLKKSKWRCRDREERKLETCQSKDTESKEGPEIQERGSLKGSGSEPLCHQKKLHIFSVNLNDTSVYDPMAFLLSHGT